MRLILIFGLLLGHFLPLTAQDSLLRNGLVVLKYPDGNRSSEGYMKDGLPNGIWKSWYPGGAMKSIGLLNMGKSDSLWKFYTEEGLLKTTIQYRSGKKNGMRVEYSPEGKPVYTDRYVEDVREGFSERFHPNGKISHLIPFEQGKEQGRAVEYDSTGNLQYWMLYRDGSLVQKRMVNRFDRLLRKTGTWLSLHPNLQIQEEMTFRNGLADGYRKTFDDQGNLLVLERYADGVLLSDAQSNIPPSVQKRFTQDGKLKSGAFNAAGKPVGMHTLTDTLSKTSLAEIFTEGKLSASGMLDSLGRRTGTWKEFYLSGEIKSEGQYQADQKTGKWMYFFLSGSTEQEGNYVNGKPSGRWRWYYEGKQLLREENYRNGLEDGFSIELSEQGDTLSYGEFIDGEREGAWLFLQGSQRIHGQFKSGQMDGTWEHRFSDGVLAFRGKYNQGIPEGKHQAFRPNGKIYWEGRYENGKREGLWRMYDADGLPYLSVEYRNGIETEYEGVRIRPEFEPADYEMLLENRTHLF